MKTEPIWKIKSQAISFGPLKQDIAVDVAIIGGGITGITTAQHLTKAGYRVAVLEGRKVGQGTTGQSTGNLYALTEYPLQELIKKYDLQTTQQIVLSRIEAMDHIRENVKTYEIDCDLKNQSMYLFENENGMDIPKEMDISKNIGLPIQELKNTDFPFPFDQGLILKNQAQFNPLVYTQRMAQVVNGADCDIYEDTCVHAIEEKDDFIFLTTDGGNVKARFAVHATHTPKGLQVQYHTTLGPYREYGIGVKLKDGKYPEGIYWGHFGNKKFSVRSYGPENNPHLICVGSMHKVGQAEDNRDNIRELEDFVKKHFNLESIEYQWGGQNYKSADMLPYIGKKTAGSNQYVATGFSTDGLIYGTLAAKIISDEIAGTDNPFSEIYKANRHQPFKAAEKFTKETVNVVGKLIGDYFKKGADEDVLKLLPEEGKLLQYEDGKYAVYKNANGKITVLSPICPHMGCTVHWNKAEKTWDCPCHGSRFDTEGKVIEGPALHGLKSAD